MRSHLLKTPPLESFFRGFIDKDQDQRYLKTEALWQRKDEDYEEVDYYFGDFGKL